MAAKCSGQDHGQFCKMCKPYEVLLDNLNELIDSLENDLYESTDEEKYDTIRNILVNFYGEHFFWLYGDQLDDNDLEEDVRQDLFEQVFEEFVVDLFEQIGEQLSEKSSCQTCQLLIGKMTCLRAYFKNRPIGCDLIIDNNDETDYDVLNQKYVFIEDLLVPIYEPTKNFESGFATKLNMKTINIPLLLEYIKFKPFPENIRKLESNGVFVDGLLLKLILLSFSNLESIQLDLIGLKIQDLEGEIVQENAIKLKQIIFNHCPDYANVFCTEVGKTLLSICTNIESIKCEDISFIDNKSNDFLPKLQSIELILNESDGKHFVHFVDKYENKLKKLKLFSSEMKFQTFKKILEQISRFRIIEELDITLRMNVINEENPIPINDRLTQIAENCTKIKEFLLNINILKTGTEFLVGNIWESLGNFFNLKRLEVTLELPNYENEPSIEALKCLKNLKFLSIQCSKIGDIFFKDVDYYLPNLKSLHLNSDYELSDTLLESLSKLKFLNELTLESHQKTFKFITDIGLSKLLDNCSLLSKVDFRCSPNITNKTFNNFIEFANKNWNIVISFTLVVNKINESLFPAIDLNAEIEKPQNLLINILSSQKELVAGTDLIDHNIIKQNQVKENCLVLNIDNINNSNKRIEEISRFGFPSMATFRSFDNFILYYDYPHREAKWVLEHLNKEQLNYGSHFKIRKKFKKDQSIHEFFRSSDDDYKNSGYDRGHLAGRANHKSNKKIMDQTFALSNICPQVGQGFNQSKWGELEQHCRDKVKLSDNVYICTGPLIMSQYNDTDGKVYVKYEVIGENDVAVPTHFCKVLVIETKGLLDLESYLMPNTAIDESTPLEYFMTSIDTVEKAAGIQFFQRIPRNAFRTINGKSV